MPESSPLRTAGRWAGKARDATAERDAAIVAARDAGYSLRDVAVAVGLSHAAVAKIVSRTTPVPVDAGDNGFKVRLPRGSAR